MRTFRWTGCRHGLTLCLALLSLCAHGGEPVLRYQLLGLQGEARENARAFLGPPPVTEEERANFLYSVQGDVERSLNTLGYYQPHVELRLERDDPVWSLQIQVDPGRRVRLAAVDVQVRGEAGEDPAFDQLLQELPLHPGDGLHHGIYEDFKSRLQTLGNDRGYFDDDMTAHRVTVDVERAEARITLHYDSGPRYHFGPVHFDEFPLNPRRLAQLLTFEQGDPFDIDKLQHLQGELQRTGYFGSALVRPLPPDPATREVPLQVSLEPGDRNHYRAGLGYSTDTKERVSLTWRTPLLNRGGHWQETRLEYSPVRPRANFTYGIPLTHPLDDQLRLGARLESNKYGSLDSWQLEFSAARNLTIGDWVTNSGIRYLREDWELGPSDLNNEYLLPGISISHTASEGSALDPEVGFSQLYALEFGIDQAGSDLDLLHLYTNLRGVLKLTSRHRLVARAELGAVFFEDKARPDLAPSLSFFAGGTHSIRGYAYQSLGPRETVIRPDGSEARLVVGGDRLAVASVEYQYYVTPEWRAALFLDGGNAFNAGDFDPVAGAGFGVHYVSPVGAVRIDLGNSVSEDNPSWRVHISLGAEF